MRRFPALIAAVALTVPTVLAVSATPSGALLPIQVTATGTAHCNVDTGHETYTLSWTVANDTGAVLTIVDDSVESGAFTGTVNFTPNPVPVDGSATGSDGPVPNVAGTVTLTVDWSYTLPGTLPVTGTSVGTIDLDGSCRLPTTTSIAPTTTAQRSATVVRPHFTG